MLFTALQSALVARLQSDAYFSDPVTGVTVLAENRMDLLAELDASLARLGLAAVVILSRIAAGERRECIVTITLQVQEIPFINRAASGTQKSASDVLVKVLSLWDRPWTPDENAWSYLEFQNFSLTEVDEQNARITWTAEFTIVTYLETVVPVLATASSRLLVTGSGEALLTSPTAP